jgi:hypothetical protein
LGVPPNASVPSTLATLARAPKPGLKGMEAVSGALPSASGVAAERAVRPPRVRQRNPRPPRVRQKKPLPKRDPGVKSLVLKPKCRLLHLNRSEAYLPEVTLIYRHLD